MKHIIKFIIEFIVKIVLKGLSFFVYKNKAKLFCVPDFACKDNCVDIINYTADNTLSFINYLLKHYDKDKLTFFLIYFDKQRLKDYINYIDTFHNKHIEIRFIYHKFLRKGSRRQSFKDYWNYYYNFFQSKFIITSDATMRFLYKRNSQTYISLNYFTPFKLDQLKIDTTTTIEYVISTSQLSSQILSGSCKVPIENFRVLGFPRNDNILTPRYSREKFIELLNLDYAVQKIIVYTPTHKDYEHNALHKRNILGYEETYNELNNLLEAEKAILIVKLHPGQNRDCLIELDQPRIIIYEPNYQYTLYDILSYADVLLTDYTSTYFDFLLTQRPVIFNFFDKEIYEKTRGFSYDPIESICAGIIVQNSKELFSAIKTCLTNSDDTYTEHRHFINTLLNKYHDSNSSKRVLDFLNNKLKETL